MDIIKVLGRHHDDCQVSEECEECEHCVLLRLYNIDELLYNSAPYTRASDCHRVTAASVSVEYTTTVQYQYKAIDLSSLPQNATNLP